MTEDDVPTKVDFRDPAITATWVAEAEDKGPQRPAVRQAIAERVAEVGRARVVDASKLGVLDAARMHILELGPGPGLLAEAIYAACEVERYVLFDFAQPMLDLAKQRLGERPRYMLGDFLDPQWPAMLEGQPFDAIVAMQSVHELRHKRRAQTLYAQAKQLMRPGSVLVVADHEPKDERPLFMTANEQCAAMTAAGFTNPVVHATFEGAYVVSSLLGST
ncbi:MAG: class I SAM-dependent methyltransferase [Myxococcota bacterium]|nr:class I SAM-dependent methyltransferase [Deltaproteobacteria bacterium]MDQ3337498.1 class I SAM-dependent methyltransferase [Myxococcota bacterium]